MTLRLVAPAAARRLVAVLLGIGAVVGVAGPASAAAAPAPAAVVSTVETPLDWPLSPGAASAPAAPLDRPAGPPVPAAATSVVVEPGDSLWRLAAERLPVGAPAAQVAAAWPAWWSANRQLIGDDPDLLHPGQRLVVPPPATPAAPP